MRLAAVIAFAALLAGFAQACISIPVIEVGGQNLSAAVWDVKDNAGLPGDYPIENITAGQFDAYMNYAYNDSMNSRNYWAELNLTQTEKAVIWDFVKHGYAVKEMAPEQYSEFRSNALVTNLNPFTCDYYAAVAYREGFAGYVFSQYSDKTPGCMNAPRAACGGGSYSPFLNDLAQETSQVATPTPEPNTQGLPVIGGNWFGAGSAAPSVGEKQDGGHETSGVAGSNLLRDLAAGGAVILVLAAFGAYMIITRRQGGFEIPDAEMHRALSSDTRLGLMRELRARDLTPTDLSSRVGKSKATVVEHLDRLRDAGFVEKKEEEGKKFVFYGLTRKGKEILRQAG